MNQDTRQAASRDKRICLWVDDIRTAPEGWIVARTITEAIRIIATMDVQVVSLDHDIAYLDERGQFVGKCSAENYSAVAWFIAAMPEAARPTTVLIHTANPIAAVAMMEILKGRVQELVRDTTFSVEWGAGGKSKEAPFAVF